MYTRYLQHKFLAHSLAFVTGYLALAFVGGIVYGYTTLPIGIALLISSMLTFNQYVDNDGTLRLPNMREALAKEN